MSRQPSHAPAAAGPALSRPARSDAIAPARGTPADAVRQSKLAPGALRPYDVLQLQRASGNRAVTQLLASSRRPAVRADRPGPAAEHSPTGLPATLHAGLESLSGMDLSDVRVHPGSPQPGALGALAYTRGDHIYLGPGQERHLPHEGWHVVQQRRGQVKPTMQLKGASINHDEALEQEADDMGARVARGAPSGEPEPARGIEPARTSAPATTVVQRKIGLEFELQVPVDALGSQDPIAIAKLNYDELGNAGAKEKTDLYTDPENHLRITVDSADQAKMLPLYNLPFPRVMSPSILELVIDPPASTSEELRAAVDRCQEVADQIDKNTHKVAARAPLLNTGYHVGLVNNELGAKSTEVKVDILKQRKDLDSGLHLSTAIAHYERSVADHEPDTSQIEQFLGLLDPVDPGQHGLSTSASIQVNLGVNLRRFADYAEWYARQYIGPKKGTEAGPEKAVALASGIGRALAAEMRGAHLLGPTGGQGIEGLLTLLAMYLLGSRAKEKHADTEKNFTYILSKTALYEAFQRSLTRQEQAFWLTNIATIKDHLLAWVSQQLDAPVTGTHRVINAWWADPEPGADRGNPEYFDQAKQKSRIKVTVDEFIDDITSGARKDRLLMRLFYIPTNVAQQTPYEHTGTKQKTRGPIPLDAEFDGTPLTVVEFRNLPGFHAPSQWSSIAKDFFSTSLRLNPTTRPTRGDRVAIVRNEADPASKQYKGLVGRVRYDRGQRLLVDLDAAGRAVEFDAASVRFER